ncbi:hypothetical protein [Variovorax sp. dw_308]|uniref:hypothetical protein n=1 Tax=Variovorax sp. dw_308 TaxID=2721546 RepID=UPI001C488738|nr:hypothetical protein [Variovorax sp. dw_308]
MGYELEGVHDCAAQPGLDLQQIHFVVSLCDLDALMMVTPGCRNNPAGSNAAF